MNKETVIVKYLRSFVARGILTPQQFGTLKGQVLKGDIEPAVKGLNKIIKRKGMQPINMQIE